MHSLREIISVTYSGLGAVRWQLRDERSRLEQRNEIRALIEFLLEVLDTDRTPTSVCLYARRFSPCSPLKLNDNWFSDKAAAELFFALVIDAKQKLSDVQVKNFERFVPLVVAGLKEAAALLCENRFQQAGDCIDAIHEIPSAVASLFWKPKDYWNNYLRQYKTKWKSDVFETFAPLFFVRPHEAIINIISVCARRLVGLKERRKPVTTRNGVLWNGNRRVALAIRERCTVDVYNE